MNTAKRINKNNIYKYIIMATAFFYTVVFSWYSINKAPLFLYEKQGIVSIIAFLSIAFLICILKYAPSNMEWSIFIIVYCVLFATQAVFVKLQPVYIPIVLPAVIIAVLYKPYSGIVFHLMYVVSFYYIVQSDKPESLIYYLIFGIIACLLTDFMKSIKSIIDSFIIMGVSYMILVIIWMQYNSGKVDYMGIFPGFIQLFFTMAVCFVCVIGRKFNEIRKKPAKSKYSIYCNEDFAPIKELRDTSLRVFYHTLEVADLSAAAAAAIGADAMLARAGAMYHDIGKTMSNNYVKAGIIIAKENNVPQEVINIIEEHNGKIRKPQSAEAAIVLLSDTLVATKDYMMKSGGKMMEERKLIDNVMSLRLDGGLIDESGLTLSQFREIKKVFISMRCGSDD
ncbi:MAG: HDIG domain-containing protein [Lachnospiraceae bacterium]|nr:HDIG domain-containing protein [Lachnospiraceae bacterium]